MDLPYWTALALGFFGGAHCAGMCGPLMFALPAGAGGRWRFALGRLVYQGGRILTYSALGAVLGVAGRSLLLIGAQRWVSVGLGVALLTGLVVSPRALEVPWLARRVSGLRLLMGRFLRQRTLGALAVLGALNGLLPCGLVYVAGASAIAAGGVLEGMATMALFGLGTLPVMLGISLSGRLATPAIRLRLRALAPVSVFAVGVLLVLRGLGLGIPYVSPALDAGGGVPACCVAR
jgi:sulfite exporter TauE/SafE